MCVCLSVCVCIGHTGDLCKNGWTSWDAIWGVTHVGPRNHVIDGSRYRRKKGHFWVDVLAGCTVPMRECSVHCLPTIADEFACPVPITDCIHYRTGWQDGNVAFFQITLDSCLQLAQKWVFCGTITGVEEAIRIKNWKALIARAS